MCFDVFPLLTTNPNLWQIMRVTSQTGNDCTVATPHSSSVKGKWTQKWRQQQSADKSSFVQHQTGSSTHSVGPWEFVAASVSSRRVLATLTTIHISTAIYLPDNYWVTFKKEVNVCAREKSSFLTSLLILSFILSSLRQMKNKTDLTFSSFRFLTEWSQLKHAICNFCHWSSFNKNNQNKRWTSTMQWSSVGSWDLFISLLNSHSCR